MQNQLSFLLAFFFSVFLGLIGYSQVNFESLTLDQAKEKSIQTGKPIFIDCYTVWCGQCKIMDATVFKEDKVAGVYNKNYINIKIDMEGSEDGVHIARKYRVNAFPTFIIIDSNGNLLGKRIGKQTSDKLVMFSNTIVRP